MYDRPTELNDSCYTTSTYPPSKMHSVSLNDVSSEKDENLSVLHKSFSDLREKIGIINDRLEQISLVLSGRNVKPKEVGEGIPAEPQYMCLGENVAYIDKMLGDNLKIIDIIYSYIGMDTNKRY